MEVYRMPDGTDLEVVTTNELAAELGVRPGSLEYWRVRGLPHYTIKRFRRRTIRYPYREALEWIEEWSSYETKIEKDIREYKEQVLDKKSALSRLRAEYQNRIDQGE